MARAEESREEVRLNLLILSCVECGRPWLDRHERWRAYTSFDDDIGLFCPDCAVREFDT